MQKYEYLLIKVFVLFNRTTSLWKIECHSITNLQTCKKTSHKTHLIHFTTILMKGIRSDWSHHFYLNNKVHAGTTT